MYSFTEYGMDMKDMLLEIAERNKIIKYNFVFYVPFTDSDHFLSFSWSYDRIKESVNESIRNEISLDPSYFNSNNLDALEKEISHELEEEDVTDGCLGIKSLVKVRGSGDVFHMKQMDFAYPSWEGKPEKIKEGLEMIDSGSGYVINSGKSYHFHGLEILPRKDWKRWMGRCHWEAYKEMKKMYRNDVDFWIGENKDENYTQILDVCWPRKQIVRGSSILRILEGAWKKEPVIVFSVKK